jgi:hypothetical protein
MMHHLMQILHQWLSQHLYQHQKPKQVQAVIHVPKTSWQ